MYPDFNEQEEKLRRFEELRQRMGLPPSSTASLRPSPQQQPPPSMSWWQKPLLSSLAQPFTQLQEKVITPLVAKTYGEVVNIVPGKQWGEENFNRATFKKAGLNPVSSEYRKSWEETKMPWGVKGTMETLPWLAMPSVGAVGTTAKAGTGIAGALARTAPKLGVLAKPTQVAAKAIEFSPYGLAEKGSQVALRTAGKTVTGLLKKPVLPGAINKAGLLPDLQPFDEVVELATRPDLARSMANLPGVRKITGVLSPSTVAKTPGQKAIAGYSQQLHEGSQKALIAMQELERLGDPERIWGKLNKEGIFETGPFAGKSAQEIFEQPAKYNTLMDNTQRGFLEKSRQLREARLELLDRNDIKVNLLTPPEGGEFAERIVVGKKMANGQYLEVGYISGGPKGIGGKLTSQQHRAYKDIEEAKAKGLRYAAPWEAQKLSTEGAYRSIAQKEMKDWLLTKVDWRSTEVMNLPKANNLVNRALQPGHAKAITQEEIAVLERDMPVVGAKFREAMEIKDWDGRYSALKGVKDYMRTMTPTHTEELAWAVEALAHKRTLAQNTEKALMRVKRGERLPPGTIKAMSKIMPDAADKLNEVSRYTLQDLIKAGAEAAEYPKTLRPATAGLREKYETALAQAQAKLDAQPGNGALFREVQSLKRKVAFTKYRQKEYARFKETGEGTGGMEFSKSPVSILKGQHYDAINELLDVVRGTPYKTTTAGGNVVTKYKGGLIKEFLADELRAREIRRGVVLNARTVQLGEAAINQPAFRGKIFTGEGAKELVDTVNKSLDPQFNETLRKVNQANSVMRFFQLAGDASAFTIQLIFLAGAHPGVYGDGLKGFVKALLNPEYAAKQISDNADLLAKHRGIINPIKGTTEITESLGPTGMLSKLPVVKQTLMPLARAYEGAMTDAGISLAKSLDYLATTPERIADIDNFINEFRGLASSAKLGVDPVWRQMETATALAAQYNRAIAALLTDVGKGGLRGELAREHMARGVAALAGMTVAISAARGETPDEIVEHLNPGSPKFMTWDVAGQNVGPGSKVRSVLVAWARALKEPDKLWTQSMENPALAFIRGNLSPVASDSIDILTGKNYLGDPTREGMLSFSKEMLAPALLPLWVQEFALESGSVGERGARAGAQFAGLRAFPETPYQEMEKLGEEATGKVWQTLQPYEKARLYVQPEVRELVMQFKNKDFVNRMQLIWKYYDAQQARDKEFTEGRTAKGEPYSGKQWKEEYGDAMGQRAAAIKQLDVDLGGIDRNPTTPEEKARTAYFDLQESFTDKTTNRFDIAGWESAKEQYLAKLDPAMRKYIEDNDSIYETPMVKFYKQVQQRLKPYWGIETEAWANYPPELKKTSDEIEVLETGGKEEQRKAKQLLYRNPTIFWVRKKVLMAKEQMRRRDPEMAGYLRRFYS